MNLFVMSMGKAGLGVEVRRREASDAEWEWGLARGEVNVDSPVLFEITRGTVLPDVIWTGFYPIISAKALGLIEREGISGCRAYPCCLGTDQAVESPYFVLGVVRRCGEISFVDGDSEACRIRVDAKGRRLLYAPLDVDLSGWDGSDVFMGRSKRTAHRCVSEKVYSAFRQQKISGIRFDSLDQCEMCVGIV